MGKKSLGTELVWRTWTESWAHLRHLESTRSQYLGFFLSAAFATGALSAGPLSNDALRSNSALLIFASVLLAFNVLAAAMFPAIARINVLCEHYRNKIDAIGDEISARYWVPVDLQKFRDPPDAPVGTVQTAASTLLGLSLLGFPLALVGVAVRAATVEASCEAIVGCSVALTLGTVASVVSYLSVKRGR